MSARVFFRRNEVWWSLSTSVRRPLSGTWRGSRTTTDRTCRTTTVRTRPMSRSRVTYCSRCPHCMYATTLTDILSRRKHRRQSSGQCGNAHKIWLRRSSVDQTPTKILLNEIWYRQNRHQERLCKPINVLNRQVAKGFAPDTTGGAYCSASQTPSWWGRRTSPPQEPHHLSPSSSDLLPIGPRHSTDPHDVVDTSAPLIVNIVRTALTV